MTADSKFVQLGIQAGQVFTPGAPINEKDLFAGRIEQVRQILDSVNQRGYHVVLYGERGVGKTSLSNVLSSFLGGGQLLFSRTNCDASDDYTSLWKKAFSEVIYTSRRQKAGFVGGDIEEAQKLVDTLPEKLTPDIVRRLLSQLATSLTVVAIFDEFDRLKDPTIVQLMADTIKVLSDYSVPATVLIIGVADSVDDLIHEHHSIERALVQIPMPRMSDQEVTEIINRGLGRLGMSITNTALAEIVDLSQGLPYIAHLLGLNCARSAIGRESLEIGGNDGGAGIDKALDQWQHSIKSSYYEATKSPQPGHIYKEVVLACSLAEVDDLRYFTAASVRKPLRLITGKDYDIPNFARHLKELSEAGRGGILQRTGEKRRIRYRMVSPMLRPYIVMRAFKEKMLTRAMLTKLQSS
ncbi:AAA family ATPase [Methylobacterium sp. J-072]|uniref:AAA family ATPase n=1 Tax=Methylobacterium sp. J-072 TaxID=2836651 RepID=UPI001FB8EB0B|nr:AAA family ATPase [Methylobacterium sp. J-072]MCJ2095502.1 AAA family ATPase [Methylobacterium sp. J-072]